MVHGEKIKTPLKLIFTHTVMLDFGLDGAIQIGCGITDMVMEMCGDMDITIIGLDLSLIMVDFMTPLTHFMDIIIHFIMDTDIHIIFMDICILTTILTITIITIIGVTAVTPIIVIIVIVKMVVRIHISMKIIWISVSIIK